MPVSTELLLLGHRGARKYAPENTFAAFDLALTHGADGFEFDVRRTRDGANVIGHDPRLNRLIVRKSSTELMASSLTFAAHAMARMSLAMIRGLTA